MHLYRKAPDCYQIRSSTVVAREAFKTGIYILIVYETALDIMKWLYHVLTVLAYGSY